MIIHDLNLAAAYADRIALLHRARLLRCGPPCEVLRSDLLSEVFECPLRVLQDVDGADHLIVVPERRSYW